MNPEWVSDPDLNFWLVVNTEHQHLSSASVDGLSISPQDDRLHSLNSSRWANVWPPPHILVHYRGVSTSVSILWSRVEIQSGSVMGKVTNEAKRDRNGFEFPMQMVSEPPDGKSGTLYTKNWVEKQSGDNG